MTYTDIQKALMRHMGQWPGLAETPVWVDGAIIPAAVKSARDGAMRAPWIRFTIIWSKAFTAGAGSKPCRRIPGVITAEIYYPRVDNVQINGLSKNPAVEVLRIADSLAEHFGYWQESYISTLATSVVNVEPESDWYRRNVVTDFDAD